VAKVPRVQPADAHLAEIADRTRRKQEAYERYERHGGETAVKCASALIELFNENNMPKALQGRILLGLHRVHDAGLLVVSPDIPVALNFSKSIDGLYNRGDSGCILDGDINITSTSFCMEAMLQTSKTVDVVRTDIGETIQSILLDCSIRPGSFLMETRDGPRRQYVDENGTALRGTSCHHGSMWYDNLQTVPDDGVMLAVLVHTDGVDSCGKSEKPISIQLANFPLGDGCGDRRMRCFALGAEASIRFPRGTNISETLTEETDAQKNKLKNRTMADALSELEGMALVGAEFWVRDHDGSLIRKKMYPRLLVIQADMAEQQALVAVASYDCHGCLGQQHATQIRGGKKNPRPFMSLDSGGYCATAEKRTVLNVAAAQVTCLRVARNETVTAARKLERKLGVKFLVENSLCRLSNLIRHEVGGPYGVMSVDMLHAFKTGAVPKLCRAWDAASHKYHAVTEYLVSSEDVRHFVDDRLMQLPQQYRKPSFALGFWSGDGVGTIKGEEVTTLLELLAIIFCGCDLLINNKAVRLQLSELTRNMLTIMTEAYTPQWYSKADDGHMAIRVRNLVQSMHKVMDFLELPDGKYPEGLGNLFNIPKVHAIQGVAMDSMKFGQLSVTDTEAGERSQRGLKAANVFVNHSEKGINKTLLKRIVARDRDAACTEQKKSKRARRQEPESMAEVSAFSKKPHTLGHGMTWQIQLSALASGKVGPAVSDVVNETTLSVAIIQAAVLAICGPQITPAHITAACQGIFYCETVSRKCVSKHVTRFNFKVGHCILTNTGNVVQLLVPLVGAKVRYDAGIKDDALCVVFDFESVDPTRPLYPELPLPWLRRGKVTCMHVIDLVRRVHLCPLFGNVHRKKNDFRPHFVLNTLGDPYYEGPQQRKVFMKCNYLGCQGTLPEPKVTGSIVACTTCGKAKPWF
jgi:hypothetical protein